MARIKPTPRPAPAAPEQPGGKGDRTTTGTTGETRLLARAAAENWPLTPEARGLAVEKLVAVLKNERARPREQIAAVRALISMGLVNLTSVETSIHADTHEDVKRRLAALEAAEAKR